MSPNAEAEANAARALFVAATMGVMARTDQRLRGEEHCLWLSRGNAILRLLQVIAAHEARAPHKFATTDITVREVATSASSALGAFLRMLPEPARSAALADAIAVLTETAEPETAAEAGRLVS